mgnify:FL=1
MYLAHSRLIPAFTAPSTGIFNQPMNVFSQPVNAFSQPVNAFSQPVNAFSQPTAQPSLYQPIMRPASAECPKYSPKSPTYDPFAPESPRYNPFEPTAYEPTCEDHALVIAGGYGKVVVGEK